MQLIAHETRSRARVVREFGEVPKVFGHEARVGQVFLNLLRNAAQAMPEGGVDAHEIRLTTRTDAAGRAVIEVRDDGAGIAPEHLGRIFDPFFTTKPVGEGTGLGLWTSHGIVTAMGGEITVESRVGGGTTVRVTLPPIATAAAITAGSSGLFPHPSPRASAAPGAPRRG